MVASSVSSARDTDPEEGASAVENASEAQRPARLAPPAPGADFNEVERAMLERRSIRRFKRAQVPPHVIRRLLEVARYAPSQGNCQPWKFVVVRDREMIEAMEDYCVAQCRKLSQGFDYRTLEKGSLRYRITRAKARLLNRLKPNLLHPVPMAVATLIAQGRFRVFHAAPTVILMLVDQRGIGAPDIDIGICGSNLVLAAQSFGLGTCWVGFAKLLADSPEWRARLGAEFPYAISEAICVGYPVGDPTHLVARETHEIAWFENGRREILR